MTRALPGPALPIDPVLPELLDALEARGVAVLQAPPGAGKTTRVPLALLPVCAGKIVMLEPRRLAARAAAERLADTLGERPGDQVGYAMRGAAKRGSRIEVVTEGVLTRMLQDDPDLPGVSALVFDEFHERSLNADLGLALAWDVHQVLRPDLKIVVMSATLDAGGVATMLEDAPVITAEGRSFSVEIRWAKAPLPKGTRPEPAMAETILRAASETEGGILGFLPGEAEIRRTMSLLEGRLPKGTDVLPLYSALPFAAQRAATQPSARRKIVLATSIAETSLTIEDIRVVVDAGLARRSRFDPGRGMARLVTEAASRAETDQRAGRAGRVSEGLCYRLWPQGAHGARGAFAPPEIKATDLAPFALDLAVWGADPGDLALLDPPPQAAWAEARSLLTQLGALDEEGHVTVRGREMARLPVHPRLAAMLLTCGGDAAPLAALLSERDPLRDAGADLSLRLAALRGDRAGDAAILSRIRKEAQRLAALAPKVSGVKEAAEHALHAFPDRIAMRRPGTQPRYLLTSGTGVALTSEDGLANAQFLVVTEASGTQGADARIRHALPLSEATLRAQLKHKIKTIRFCHWSKRTARVEARIQERLDALILSDVKWPDPEPDDAARAMCDGIRTLGLKLSPAAKRFQARVLLARSDGLDLPDLSEDALLDGLDTWLAPHLGDVRSAEAWSLFDPLAALTALLDWSQTQALDKSAPAHFVAPTGRKVPIDYAASAPAIEIRLQEVLGLTKHPTIAGRPLQITLLSPAQRPIQVTQDLPGFWTGSYADVRKDMRARYPKHAWPEDPASATPTTRATRAKS